MKWLKYLAIFFLAHCGFTSVPPAQETTVIIKPQTTPKEEVPQRTSSICYSSVVSIVHKSSYENFVYDSLKGQCCKTGTTTAPGSVQYRWCPSYDPNSCKKIASQGASIQFSVTSDYKTIKNLTLGPRERKPLVLKNMSINPVNKSRGWTARAYIPSGLSSGIGGDLILDCERCDFEDTKYKMNIEIKYRNELMGRVSIDPSRPATSEQCQINTSS